MAPWSPLEAALTQCITRNVSGAPRNGLTLRFVGSVHATASPPPSATDKWPLRQVGRDGGPSLVPSASPEAKERSLTRGCGGDLRRPGAGLLGPVLWGAVRASHKQRNRRGGC